MNDLTELSLPEGWEATQISELVTDWAVGPRFSGDYYSSNGNVATLRTTDMDNDGKIEYSTMPRAQLPLSGFRTHFLRQNDLVISRSGTCGITGIFKGFDVPVLAGAFLIRFRFTDSILPLYLQYVFNSLNGRRRLLREAEGGVLKNIRGTSVLRVTVDLPPVPEQKKIARILTTIDNLIEKTEALIAKYQSIKKGMMHDLFTRGVDQEGKLRPPYEQAPQLYKDSELGKIPIEWEVRHLSEFASFITSGSRGWAQYYSDYGAVFVRIGNLTRQHINFRWDGIQYVSPPKSTEGERTRLQANDLLISVTADLGVIGVVADGFGEAYINQHIALVRFNSDEVNTRWIGHFLAGVKGRCQFDRSNDVGAKSGLNLSTVGALMYPNSSIREQERIVEILDGLDSQISSGLKCVRKYRTLKSGLMQDLLTGKVRVNVDELEEELANV